MYHLRLIKGLSYTGAVRATKKEPDVYTDDEAIAQGAVASGYFELLQDPESAQTVNDEALPPDLVPEGDGESGEDEEDGEDGDDEDQPLDFTPGDEEDEIPRKVTPDFETLSAMTKAELIAYANERGIDLAGCRTKEDILGAISVAFGGSYTMIDLQHE